MSDRRLERYARIISLYRAARNRADGLIKPYELRVRSELLKRGLPYESSRLAASVKPVKSGYVPAEWALSHYSGELDGLLKHGAVSVAAEKLREYEKERAKDVGSEGYAKALVDRAIGEIDARETEGSPRLEIRASHGLQRAVERMFSRIRIFRDFPVDPKD